MTQRIGAGDRRVVGELGRLLGIDRLRVGRVLRWEEQLHVVVGERQIDVAQVG